VNISPITALDAARRYNISAYDARFIAAAEWLETKLVTEDRKLRAAGPEHTRSLAQALDA
jgi:predicted nucleic acid-binding protein